MLLSSPRTRRAVPILIAGLSLLIAAPRSSAADSPTMPFELPGVMNLPGEPSRLLLRDFNQDGHLDAILQIDQGTEIALGRTDGTFEAPSTIAPGILPCVDDFDRDGHLDLATVNGNSIEIRLWHYAGFDPPLIESVEAPITQLVSGDVDGDGRSDLIACLPDSHEVVVLRNDGVGGFGARETYRSRFALNDVFVADLDKDGRAEIVALFRSWGGFPLSGLVVLRQRDAGLEELETIPWSPLVWDLAIADFTGDGIPDLAVRDDNGISILRGLGAGRFAFPQSVVNLGFSEWDRGERLRAWDVDHDGKVGSPGTELEFAL